MNDLRSKKSWKAAPLAAAALTALVLPLAFTSASATSADGNFGVKAVDQQNQGISKISGSPAVVNAGNGDTGDGEVIPPTEAEPSANSFVFTVDTDLCTNPTIYFGGVGTDTTIKDPSGDVNNLAEGWNSISEKGKWTVEGSFAKIGESASALRTAADGSADCLTAVTHWGDTGTVDASNGFRGSDNLQTVATPPATIENISYMFYDAPSFDADFSDWDTSNVTNMEAAFSNAKSFNGAIGEWKTGKVTNTTSMFNGASAFNQDLNWDMGQVTQMGNMFNNATSFNGNISGWDTSSVTYMGDVFNGAHAFNQPLDGWKTGNVVNMRGMFADARSFNQSLNSWDTSKVQNMEQMFAYTGAFGSTPESADVVSSWTTSNVTNMKAMFMGSKFNGNISGWNTAKVTNMDQLFYNATAFTGNLSTWNGCKVVKSVVTKLPTQFGISDTARHPRWTNCS